MQDKWRNLLRASFANSPAEKGVSYIIVYHIMFVTEFEFVRVPVVQEIINRYGASLGVLYDVLLKTIPTFLCFFFSLLFNN